MPEEVAREFVTQLYRSLLKREPDDGGLKTYVDLLCGGKPVGRIVDAFVSSDEFRILQLKTYGALPDSERFPLDYNPAGETGRSYVRRVAAGFFDKYCTGDVILDVGFAGYENPDNKTAVPGAIGIDVDYPGYDGIHLPFADDSVDAIISSHCLEHIWFDHAAIRDWHRALKIGGHIVCMVPHQYLYEKSRYLPSLWNADHKRMYTPSTLARSFEEALEPNSYRLRHLADNDEGFDYELGPELHSDGAYEIEMVIEKIAPPRWTLR